MADRTSKKACFQMERPRNAEPLKTAARCSQASQRFFFAGTASNAARRMAPILTSLAFAARFSPVRVAASIRTEIWVCSSTSEVKPSRSNFARAMRTASLAESRSWSDRMASILAMSETGRSKVRGAAGLDFCAGICDTEIVQGPRRNAGDHADLRQPLLPPGRHTHWSCGNSHDRPNLRSAGTMFDRERIVYHRGGLVLALRGGAYAHVDDVPNGLACGCVCEECQATLVARNRGEILASHFAHAAGEKCGNTGEAGLTRAAANILTETRLLMLPAVTVGQVLREAHEITIDSAVALTVRARC